MLLSRSVRRAASFAVPVALLALAGAAPAATAKPTLKLALPAQADAGARIPFTYETKGLPRRGRLVVLRQQGTAGAWRVIKTVMRRRSGSATLPAMDWGSTAYRLAVVRGNRATARSGRRYMGVFKTVTLGALTSYDEDTLPTPTRAFSYSYSALAYDDDDATVISVKPGSNTCRAIHIDWAAGPARGFGAPDGLLSLSILRQSADPVVTQAPLLTVTGMDAALTPGQSWIVSFAHPSTAVVYLNGTASCTGPISLKD